MRLPQGSEVVCLKFTDDSEKEIDSVLIKLMNIKNAKGVLFKSARI